jgi:hypothetical protein
MTERTAEYWEGFDEAFEIPPSQFRNPYDASVDLIKHNDYKAGWESAQEEIDYLLGRYPR